MINVERRQMVLSSVLFILVADEPETEEKVQRRKRRKQNFLDSLPQV